MKKLFLFALVAMSFASCKNPSFGGGVWAIPIALVLASAYFGYVAKVKDKNFNPKQNGNALACIVLAGAAFAVWLACVITG